MLDCKICNFVISNTRKLSKHIRDHHKEFTIKMYYDIYLKKENEDDCLICKNKTKFFHLGEGYKKTCGKSCSTKLNRLRLKVNPEKYNEFIEKLSKRVKEEWASKDQSVRIKNMKKTTKEKYEKMSLEEKKNRFGYLNKLEKKEKEIIIEKMTKNGFLKWWQNASEEQKRKAWNKRNEKLIELWNVNGEKLHQKQKETFLKNIEKNKQEFCWSEKEKEKFFVNLDRFFNV